jgi:hypothetical protein
MKSSCSKDSSSFRCVRVAIAALALGLGASVSGCELIVRFDESKLQDIPAVDAVRPDVASDSAPSEGGIDAGADAADTDVSQPDVATDSHADSAPDATPDASPDSAPDASPDSAPDAQAEPTVEAGVEPTPEAGVDASDDAASMVDAAMDAGTD